jgi:hypothetical protein
VLHPARVLALGTAAAVALMLLAVGWRTVAERRRRRDRAWPSRGVAGHRLLPHRRW